MKTLSMVVPALTLLLPHLAEASNPRTVNVSGVCTRQTTPDRGAVIVTAESKDKDLQAVTQATARSYEKVREEIKKLNLESVELTTTEYSVREETEWRKDHMVSKGFIARMGLAVSTSNIQRLGEVIAIASKEKIRDVGALRTYLSDEKRKQEHSACLETAAQNAREKAEKIATALKAKIGEPLTLTEVDGGGSAQPMFDGAAPKMMAFAERSAAPVQVEAGLQNVSLSVAAVFELK